MAVRELTAYEKQGDFIADDHRYVLFVGGVGSGKSKAGAIRAIRYLQRGTLGIVVAPTFRMLRDSTWRTCLEVWRPLGIVEQILRGDELAVRFINGAEVIFRSTEDPERLRGPNASWAWIDEAAQCHPQTWPIVIGRLREGSERCWITTTPRGYNWVYDTFIVRATDEVAVYHARTDENPFISDSYIRSLGQQYEGSFARQELGAEFIPDSIGQLLEWGWLNAARQEATLDPEGPALCAGLDVAGPGEDETVLAVRQGLRLLGVDHWPGEDTRGAVVARLKAWQEFHALERISVDSAGVGWERFLQLRDEFKDKVRPVNVGESPTTAKAKEQFRNLKAEIYWAFRQRCSEGDFTGLTDPVAFAQLAAIKYEHNVRGQVEIQRKEDIAKERGDFAGWKSPDRAEAIVLAFAPEHPLAVWAGMVGKRGALHDPSTARPERKSPFGAVADEMQRAREAR